MTSPTIRFSHTEGADGTVPAPAYETDGAAGADVRANLAPADRAAGITLAVGARALIPTGMRVAVPAGYELQVRPRSGLALKHGLTVLNSPGTVDSDYRGPLGVILHNSGTEPFVVTHGERIAQLVIAPVVQASFTRVDELDQTNRGEGGFGSTGRG